MQMFADIKDYTQNPFNEHQNINHNVYIANFQNKYDANRHAYDTDANWSIGCPAIFDKITPNPTQIG
jgi:hypothetical protein